MEILLQSVVNGLILGLIYTLMALGFTLIFGICRVFNFAHGELYMLGAYGAYLFFDQWHIPFLPALILTMLAMGLLGILMERLFRMVRGEINAPLIISLGLSMILSSLAWLVWGEEDKGVHSPATGIVNIFGATISSERVMLIPIAILLVAGLYFFLNRFKSGQAMEAVALDIEAASTLGIDADRSTMLAFFISAGLAGAAGMLIAPLFVINPFIGGTAIFKVAIAVIIGGLGSVIGSIFGGLFLGMVESILATYIGIRAQMVGFIILMLVLLIRPRGFLGRE